MSAENCAVRCWRQDSARAFPVTLNETFSGALCSDQELLESLEEARPVGLGAGGGLHISMQRVIPSSRPPPTLGYGGGGAPSRPQSALGHSSMLPPTATRPVARPSATPSRPPPTLGYGGDNSTAGSSPTTALNLGSRSETPADSQQPTPFSFRHLLSTRPPVLILGPRPETPADSLADTPSGRLSVFASRLGSDQVSSPR